mgnify:CR=1 FL=1
MRWLKFSLGLIPVVPVTLFLAFWVTILLVPLWRWIEADFGIEAIGHSGPAEWCFYLVFAILLAPALYLLWRACRVASKSAD